MVRQAKKLGHNIGRFMSLLLSGVFPWAKLRQAQKLDALGRQVRPCSRGNRLPAERWASMSSMCKGWSAFSRMPLRRRTNHHKQESSSQCETLEVSHLMRIFAIQYKKQHTYPNRRQRHQSETATVTWQPIATIRLHSLGRFLRNQRRRHHYTIVTRLFNPTVMLRIHTVPPRNRIQALRPLARGHGPDSELISSCWRSHPAIRAWTDPVVRQRFGEIVSLCTSSPTYLAILFHDLSSVIMALSLLARSSKA